MSRNKFLFFLVIGLLLITSGCPPVVYQGWSGVAFLDNIIYVGSMDGKVLALNPSARLQDLPFPASGEWIFAPRTEIYEAGFGCPIPIPPSIYGTPVVAKDLVYFATYTGKVYALSTSARLEKRGFPMGIKGEWEYPREPGGSIGTIVGGIVLANKTVYIGSSTGVYALDAITGELRWQFRTEKKVWTTPEVKDGVVYIGSFDGRMYALSADKGKELWHFQAPAAIASSPTVWGDTIIFGSFDRNLYAVAGGKKKWEFQGKNWFWAKPVVREGIVYAGNLDGEIYALKAETGEKLWQFKADSPIASSPVLISDFLVVASEIGKLYMIKANTGEVVKTVPLGTSILAPLYGKEDTIYAHGKDRYLYAITVPEGKVIWKFSLIVKEK